MRTVGFSFLPFTKRSFLFTSVISQSNLPSNVKSVIYLYTPSSNSYQIIDTQNIPYQAPNNFAYDLATIDSSFIYHAFIEKACPMTDFQNTLTCTNYIRYTKYDSVGNEIWQKNIGGEAQYYGLQTLATPDGGSMLIVRRYDSTINYYEYDTYYIKLDKDGNQELNYLPVATKKIATAYDGVVAFPNPTSNTIIFRYKTHEKVNITLLNLSGQIIRKLQAHFNDPIDVSELPNGLYLYNLQGMNGKMTWGKFSKS